MFERLTTNQNTADYGLPRGNFNIIDEKPDKKKNEYIEKENDGPPIENHEIIDKK